MVQSPWTFKQNREKSAVEERRPEFEFLDYISPFSAKRCLAIIFHWQFSDIKSS